MTVPSLGGLIMSNRGYQKKDLIKQLSASKVSYMFLLPYAIIFILFTAAPVVMSIVNSMTRYSILQPPVFVGFKNYIRMFTDDYIFQQSLKNTMFLALIIGPGGYFMSLLLAWMINTLSRSMRTFFVVVFYA